jgi:ArsR family transcriptional regulator, arsenate/arsenite/antimonite-responsive transcriptional repressor
MLDTLLMSMGARMSTTATLKRRGKKAEAEVAEQCCPSVFAAPLNATEAKQLAVRFSALADPVRLQLLSMLAAAPDGEVCVCDFVKPLGKSQPTVSHHMKILSDAGLVHGERRSKWVYYSLDRGHLAALRSAIDI